RPPLGWSWPASSRSSVDFPEPDSPTTASTSPVKRSKETSRHPSRGPYHLVSPSAASNGCSSTMARIALAISIRLCAGLCIVNSVSILAAVTFTGTTRSAIVAVGTHEHSSAVVVRDHLVEKRIPVSAQRTRSVVTIRIEGMILEIERDDLRIRWDGIDPLFTPCAEQLQGRAIVHLGVVELRRRRRIHHVSVGHLYWVGVARGDMTMTRDVLVELDVHDAVVDHRVHAPRLDFARLKETKGFR